MGKIEFFKPEGFVEGGSLIVPGEGDGLVVLLSLQETPLGCSSRIPSNINIFNSDELKELTHSRHA